MEKECLTPPQIAKRYGVTQAKILAFIRSGELRALNLANPGANLRPRYVISLADLADFERRREVRPRRRLKPGERCTSKPRRPTDRY